MTVLHNVHSHFLWEVENILKSSTVTPYSGALSDLSMLYRDALFIEKCIGNNSFSYIPDRILYIAPVRQYMGSHSVEQGDKIVFCDECGGKLFNYTGLFAQLFGKTGGSGTPFYLCDNHNLVLEAWKIVKEYSPLLKVVHIDQHRDDAKFAGSGGDYMRESRICDYIDFAKSARWIDSEHYSFTESKEFQRGVPSVHNRHFILNLDLDIFAPEVTNVGTEEKIELIKEAVKHTELITISTSPGFIEPERAISLAKLFISYL